jgi:hypothetical protein
LRRLSIQISGSSVFLGGKFYPSIAKVVAAAGANDPASAAFITHYYVYTLLASGGFVYVGGNFASIDGSASPGMARIAESDGTVDSTFGIFR